MKSHSLNSLLIAVMLSSLLAVSCSQSSYRYVKVTPEPFPDKETVRADEETRSEAPGRSEAPEEEAVVLSGEQQDTGPAEEAASPEPGALEEVVSVQVDPDAVAAITPRSGKAKKPASKTLRTVVHRDSQRPAAYNTVPVKKQQRLKKQVSRQMDRVAKKSGSSSFSAGILFNQWMKIGLILIVVGLVVGLAWGALGWVTMVIGLVFFVLGLIQQM